MSIGLQLDQIVLEAASAKHLHAPLHASEKCLVPVAAEIVTQPRLEDGADLQPRCLGGLGLLQWRLQLGKPAAAQAHQLARQLVHRHHQVDRAGGNGACGHVAVGGHVAHLALRQGQAAALLDHLQAQRAVAAGARQDDADRLLAKGLAQRIKKRVDGTEKAVIVRRRHLHAQPTAADRHDGVGQRDIHAIGFEQGAVHRLQHLHLGPAPQNVDQQALAVGRQVQDHHKRHAAVCGHLFKEVMKSVETAR